MARQGLTEIIVRLEKLEAVVFGSSSTAVHQVIESANTKQYSGLVGGLRLLLADGFFSTPQELGSIRSELASRGYYYRRQAVHNSLTRLAKPNGPLVVVRKGRTKSYAKRK